MDDIVQRETFPAILKGLRCRCPRCGEGRLYRRYLKVAPSCEVCGLELGKARADDLPAYISITIVGHILVVGLMHFESGGDSLQPWMYLLLLVGLSVVLPLVMLPSIKGAVVGLQWATHMHGL